MRWLAILAILVAGAAGYLAWSLSGEPAPQARANKARDLEVEAQPEPAPADSAIPATVTPRREPPPPIASSSAPARSPAVTPSSSSIDRSAPADAAAATDAPEVEWTEEQRRQQLYTAHGRYEKGNYPGAVEAAMELARRYPPWAEDGYKVAIMAHCAMSEPEKANALYAKMTDKPAIEDLTKACTGWGVALK